LKASRSIGSVALGVGLAAALAGGAGAAPGERAAVIVVPASAAVFTSPQAAHGLLSPGGGETVTRRAALAGLLRGKQGNVLLHGGVPSGKPLISLSGRPAETTFYVALPPPGKHRNIARYPIAVIGPRYRGLLTSTSTHVDGLVAIGDVALSARDLDRGEQPPIRSRASADPLGHVRWLERRLVHARDSRLTAEIVLTLVMAAFALVAFLSGRAWLGRAAFFAGPACLVAAVTLSGFGLTRPWATETLLPLVASVLSLVGGWFLRPRWALALGVAALFVFLFGVMWAAPEWNSLAALGPRAEAGGRFYGMNNEIETLLLSPAFVLGALAGLRLLPVVALLIAAGTAASSIGADGGGLVTFLAGFVTLGLRMTRAGLVRAGAVIAVAVAAAFALVGLDAAIGGSSHVTRAVGGGPGTLADDLFRRLHLSAAQLSSSWHAPIIVTVSVAALVWLAFKRPRLPVLDALLVALAVSFLVNDAPADVAGAGAGSAVILWIWLGRSAERLGPLD
jgi:hypothetical protein